MDETTPVKNTTNNLAIPAAIILAGVIIAGAIFMSNSKNAKVATAPRVQKADITLPPVTEADHILGNPKADIVIVEYSDLQCPYCTDFHTTMKKVMDKYGKKGKVAWVYRHYWAVRKLPDGSIFHPLAGKAAEASECIAELGGNDKFWAFTNDIFAEKTTQTGKLSNLSELAKTVGVDVDSFNTCLNSNKYTEAVQKSYDDAKALGVSGTPTSFLMTKSGIYPLEGYVPFEELDTIIQDLD